MALGGHAQNDNASKKWEIGLNVSHVITRVFSGDIRSDDLERHTFAIKRKAGKNTYLRFHFGGNYTSDSSIENFRTREHDFQSKLGLEKRKEVVRNFNLLYGADILFGHRSEYTNLASFTETTQRNAGIGLSIFIGFQFNISERLYISTESNFWGLYTHHKTKVLENARPAGEVRESSFSFKHTLPTSLYLFIRI